MATVTKGRTFVSGEVVTPTKLNALVDSATVTAIQTADISDAQITTAKIADSNVTTAKIADSNVTTAKIADSNVTTAKIADGAVTSAKVSSSVIFVPSGAVMAFAMNSAPSGWLAANGAAISRTTYSVLFGLIGVTYGGGDGVTTFNLPDLRGYFVRGAGINANGTASGTFAANQDDSIRDHTHTWRYDGLGRAAGGVVTNNANGSGGGIYDIGMTAGTAGPETRPKNIAMLYCIKA